MPLDDDEKYDLAYDWVDDYLDKDIEIMDVAEFVADNSDGATDDEVRAIHAKATQILREVRGSL